MQTITLARKSVRAIGGMIRKEYFDHLIEGYDRAHPTEEKSVVIPRALIDAALAESSAVCGIRFMYGQRQDADVRSRVVLLMPCYEKTTGNLVPNLFLTDEGYLTDDGTRVGLEECFEMFERHVDRMAALLPDASRKDLPRGVYFGVESLRALGDRADCAGVRFHFGYNADKDY